MTLLKNSGFPGVPAGTAVTTANSGGAAGDAFTLVSGTGLTFETTGIHVNVAASANVYCGWTGVAGASNAMAVSGYFTLPALPSPNAQVLGNARSGGGGTSFFNLLVTATGMGQIISDAAGATLGTMTTALVAGTEYRWECEATNGNIATGAISFRFYVGDSTTVYASLTLTNVNIGTGTIGQFRFGRPAAIGSTWVYDTRRLVFQTGSATAIGPWVATNIPPTANAGADQAVLTGALVTLTGTDSDTDGTIASRAWVQTAGTAVTLSGASTATATFTPTVAGTYTFSYTVTDNSGATATDSISVVVTASNVAPTANAGADQTNVEPGTTVTLTGTDSDSDGTVAIRTWTQTGGSPTVTLSGSGATRAFPAPLTLNGTTLTFLYTVTDNLGASTSDPMTVTVLPASDRIMIGGVWVAAQTRLF